MKLLGAVVYSRVIHEAEDCMDPAQYVYGRGREADMHLIELAGSI